MPAMLFEVGDWVSSIPTSVAALQDFFSHNSETSSSVGPICPPLFDSEGGKQSSMRGRHRPGSGDPNVALRIDWTLAVLGRDDDERRVGQALFLQLRCPFSDRRVSELNLLN